MTSHLNQHNVSLPSTQDALVLLSPTAYIEHVENDTVLIKLNDMCVTLWLDDKNEKTWYLGYCNGIDYERNEFLIEHLHRHKEGSNRKWVQLENADVCRIGCKQIFKCEVVGDWDVSTRNMKYILSNHGQIDTQVSMI